MNGENIIAILDREDSSLAKNVSCMMTKYIHMLIHMHTNSQQLLLHVCLYMMIDPVIQT